MSSVQLFFCLTSSTRRDITGADDSRSVDSALSSDDTGPCSSSDVTPSSETSLSDLSPAAEPSNVLSPQDHSASKQLTELAQLVQEHYAYTTTDNDTDRPHTASSQ
ncbi:hypothetical protein BaRGS_00007806 [Batillaria attramentaria]|uniref:Uncharacterized protein n=1 Tax=Batillaria attramentaria TaxID=370345 RepID=A0ABD0LNR5_9CAEN